MIELLVYMSIWIGLSIIVCEYIFTRIIPRRNKTKLTHEILFKLGFKCEHGFVNDGYIMTEQKEIEDPITQDKKNNLIIYREISITLCNDKGKGEYYLYMREGNNSNRSDDDLITFTRNLMYKEELELIIKLFFSKED